MYSFYKQRRNQTHCYTFTQFKELVLLSELLIKKTWIHSDEPKIMDDGLNFYFYNGVKI